MWLVEKWCENFEPITEWSNANPKQFTNYCFRQSIEFNRSIQVDMIDLNDFFNPLTPELLPIDE